MRYLVLVALLSCGDDGATGTGDAGPSDAPNHADDNGHDGTRLKVIWFHAGDTWQPSSTRFWDAKLGEYCSPAVWVDGITRCTPNAGEIVFDDATCTQLLGRVSYSGDTPPAPARRYVEKRWVGNNVRVAAVYGAGQSLGGGSRMAYDHAADGSCHVMIPTQATYYRLGEPQTDFAAMSLDEPPGSDQLVPTIWTSDDGLRVAVGLRDRAAGSPCRLVLRSDGTTVDCTPRSSLKSSLYRDSACSEAIAVWLVPKVQFIITTESRQGCLVYATTTYVGFSPSAAPAYSGNTCMQTTLPTGFVFMSDQLLAIASATRMIESVPERRYQHIVINTGAFSAVSDTLFDTQTGYECGLANNDTMCFPFPQTTQWPCVP